MAEDINKNEQRTISARCECLVTLLIEQGYPVYSINHAVSSILDERDLYDLLRFLVRHWQPKAE